jgi:hypothetical protein
MAAHQVAATAIANIVLYPGRSYRASPFNRTTYAVDAGGFQGAWRAVGHLPELIIEAMVKTDVTLPRFGVGAAAAAMVGLMLLAVRRWRRGETGPAPAAAAAAAAAGAVCLPAALNLTRTDLCHLAFVAGGGLIAGASLLALGRATWGSTRPWRWLTSLISALLAVLVVAAGGLYAYAATRPYSRREDIDAHGRALLNTDLAVARTRPTDEVYMASFEGWHYFYTGRGNPTPFFWLYEDPISADHWPIAAAAIREKKPRLLLMPSRFFARLVRLQPELRSLYFGEENNFMLDDRRPGPALAATRPWTVTATDDRAAGRPPMGWHFVDGGRSSRLEVEISRPGPGPEPSAAVKVMGSIDGDIVCVFDGESTYVGTLASDGARIEGRRFEHNHPAVPFTATAGAN